MGETVKAFFTRLCTTYSFIKQNKEVLAKSKRRKNRTVRGREKEREFQSHCRDYHWFGEIISPVFDWKLNGRQGRKL